MKTAILILNWNGKHLLDACLQALNRQTQPDCSVFVIDNASHDGSAAHIAQNYLGVTILQHASNLGFVKGYNRAFEQLELSDYDLLLLLNNDVVLHQECVGQLIQAISSDPTIGIVGCKLYYPDGRIQHAGGELAYPTAFSTHYQQGARDADAGQPSRANRDVPFVTGAAFGITRAAFAQLGGFDERFSPFYFEEVDYCYRARAAGLRVVLAGQAIGVHHESESIGAFGHMQVSGWNRNRLRFVCKHYSASQLLDDFVPVEQQRIATLTDAVQLQTLRQSLLQVALEQADDASVIQTTLLLLNAACLQRLNILSAMDSHVLQTMQSLPALTEFAFPPGTPGVGRLLGRLRRAWYAVAAKWALRHLIEQQSSHNYQARQLYAGLTATQLEVALLHERVAQLEQQLAALSGSGQDFED